MMRKISDLFTRAESAQSIEREDLEGGVAAMIDYRTTGDGVDQMALIARFYDLIGFPRSMRPGNLAHVSGVAGDQIIFTSVWDSESNAATAYAAMGPAIEQVLKDFGPNARVERHSSGVYRFSIGENADEFSHRAATTHPNCVGFLLDVPVHGQMAYDLVCNKMRFPEEFPDGLLMHVAGQTDRGWRTCSIWREIEQSRAFLEQRLMPAAVDVVRDTGMFPEIRPLEFKPFMFALNARMLG
jgi:hypothetical protein